MPDHQTAVPAAALAALSNFVLEGRSLEEALSHICAVAVATLPGAEEASVTLLGEGTGTGMTYGA
ncbi:MAG TPA: hypothetical protein VNT56_02945, partial [Acidimicrobiales bacterium]|nr:hypothetical protein [Acidimicrobiales bacterium]